MKKAWTLLLTLIATTSISALPVGNPCDSTILRDGLFCVGNDYPYVNWCNAWSVRFGYYGDYVFNKSLEIKGSGKGDIDRAFVATNAALLVLNLWDRIDLFTTLGDSEFRFDTNNKDFLSPVVLSPTLTSPEEFYLQTETDFSWSVGARGSITCLCGFCFGAEIQYFYFDPNIKYTNSVGNYRDYPNQLKAKYREFQVGFGAAYDICETFIPYIAARWSHTTIGMSGTSFFPVVPQGGGAVVPTPYTLRNLESKNEWGGAIGVTLMNCWNKSLTFEGRYGGERAMHVNAQIRF